MLLDHVFICCDRGAPEADALVALGLNEGSSNVHLGQGTSNRRFFFLGGYLEFLWVSDPDEAQSELTSPTKLYERWSGRQGSTCPFGIVFGASESHLREPPFEVWHYRPQYLPADRPILFAKDTSLEEPALFYLPWSKPQPAAAQPMRHPVGFERLCSVSIGLPDGSALSRSARAVQSAGLLEFHSSRQ